MEEAGFSQTLAPTYHTTQHISWKTMILVYTQWTAEWQNYIYI